MPIIRSSSNSLSNDEDDSDRSIEKECLLYLIESLHFILQKITKHFAGIRQLVKLCLPKSQKHLIIWSKRNFDKRGSRGLAKCRLSQRRLTSKIGHYYGPRNIV